MVLEPLLLFDAVFIEDRPIVELISQARGDSDVAVAGVVMDAASPTAETALDWFAAVDENPDAGAAGELRMHVSRSARRALAPVRVMASRSTVEPGAPLVPGSTVNSIVFHAAGGSVTMPMQLAAI